MILKRSLLIILCASIILFTFNACTNNSDEKSKISVVATLFPQYDFAKAILGDRGDVSLLLSPGANSHSFELTASDISKINSCDIFIYTGPNMEIWVDGIVDSINNKVAVVNLSKKVSLQHSDNHSHDKHNQSVDPHIWTSPVIAVNMLTEIYNAICMADPDNKEFYTDNYQSCLKKLEELDASFRDLAQNAKNKTLYFSGKFAFLYFVNEYGFNYVAPFNSCSDLQVEDLASVAGLVNEMQKNDVKYIFYEEFASSDLYLTLSAQTGATPLLLHSAHNIGKDDFEKGITYYDIMLQNLVNLKRALLDG